MSGVIRLGSPIDASSIGQVFLRARDEMTYLPRIPDEDRSKLGGWISSRHQIWVVEELGRVLGFAGVSEGWLDHLYIDPNTQGHGFGSRLLQHVKTLQPEGLRLWVFQQNLGARRFYERHGFRLEKLTDGSSNIEREPDALYSWLIDRSHREVK